MKKIFLSLLMVISFLFLSGFTTLAENKVYAQEYPSGLYKATYERFQYIQENAKTHEYMVYYVVPFVIPNTISENDYYFLNNIDEVFRKGINRNTNSYVLENQVIDNVNRQTVFSVRVTVLTSLLDSQYPDGMIPLFENDTAFYINIRFSDVYGFDVTDYFGERNLVEVSGVNNYLFFDGDDPSSGTGRVAFNKVYSGENIYSKPSIPIEHPYLVVMMRKNYYDQINVIFDNAPTLRHDRDAIHFDVDDYDIYIFNLSNLMNSKYLLEIKKENITQYEAMVFHQAVLGNLYFSHAPKLLNSDQAFKFYEMGYLKGLEEQLKDDEAYQIGYDNGYNRGYYDGNNEGYEKGYDLGYDTGYDKGYTIGNNEGYENGYRTGYERGFNDGKTADYDRGYDDGYKQGTEDGYNRGVKDGYKQGSNDGFLNDVAKWFGPMVLIVLIAGAYVTARNRRSGD